jgi:predicted lipid-binding transport protein (Tim44 family)
MRRTLPAACAAAAALALAGCGGGGSKSDEDAVRTTVSDYFSAFADGDGAAACNKLDFDTQAEIATAAKVTTCSQALEAAAARPEVKQYLDDVRDVDVVNVEVNGSEATAKVKAIGQTTTMTLHKIQGEWRIEGGADAAGG